MPSEARDLPGLGKKKEQGNKQANIIISFSLHTFTYRHARTHAAWAAENTRRLLFPFLLRIAQVLS